MLIKNDLSRLDLIKVDFLDEERIRGTILFFRDSELQGGLGKTRWR